MQIHCLENIDPNSKVVVAAVQQVALPNMLKLAIISGGGN